MGRVRHWDGSMNLFTLRLSKHTLRIILHSPSADARGRSGRHSSDWGDSLQIQTHVPHALVQSLHVLREKYPDVAEVPGSVGMQSPPIVIGV